MAEVQVPASKPVLVDGELGADPTDVVASKGTALRASRSERGMVSAEWAVGIIAAIAIAGVLIAVVTNGQVQAALLAFVLKVIHAFSGYLIK